MVGLMLHKVKPYHYFMTCHKVAVHVTSSLSTAPSGNLDTAHKIYRIDGGRTQSNT